MSVAVEIPARTVTFTDEELQTGSWRDRPWEDLGWKMRNVKNFECCASVIRRDAEKLGKEFSPITKNALIKSAEEYEKWAAERVAEIKRGEIE